VNHYNNQVGLLLRLLPFIAREQIFALHGGSAINLFHFEMPRLSVDIDLTYIPFSDRDNDLSQIQLGLERIKMRLLNAIPGINVREPLQNQDEYKLFCSLNGAEVKIEVNTINRGVFQPVEMRLLCSAAQNAFSTFCEMPVVSVGQLFGGKIVAALDRQHPRDLFDVNNILKTFGWSKEISDGFVFCLLSSKRPIHELLNPSFIDQHSCFQSQFSGMTNETFSYEMFETVRTKLIETILSNISPADSDFIISFADAKPNWEFKNYSRFPGIQWKLQNLQKLKSQNPDKFQSQHTELKRILFSSSNSPDIQQLC